LRHLQLQLINKNSFSNCRLLWLLLLVFCIYVAHSGRAVSGKDCLRLVELRDPEIESHTRHICFCAFIVRGVVETLRRADPHRRGPTVYRIKKLKLAAKVQQLAIEPLIINNNYFIYGTISLSLFNDQYFVLTVSLSNTSSVD
jgi:hypothetical protein